MNYQRHLPGRKVELPLTHWSMVRRAFPDEQPQACPRSQEEFCRIYWPVIHLFLRHKHHYSHHDAEDLAQGFVAWLLASGSMEKSREEKGRFRSFLLAHLDNYVRNQHQKEHAQKRGGHVKQVSMQEVESEIPPAEVNSPDQELQRAWAIATLREAHEQLKKSYAQRGKEALFTQLVPFLNADEDERRALAAAASLHMTLPAFRMARSRFRKEFGKCIADLVAATVDSDEDFAAEMQLLREVAG